MGPYTETVKDRITCRVLDDTPKIRFYSGPRTPYWRIVLDNNFPSPLGEFTSFPDAVQAYRNYRAQNLKAGRSKHHYRVVEGLTQREAQAAYRPPQPTLLRQKRIREWEEHGYEATDEDLDNITNPEYQSELEKKLYDKKLRSADAE